jgi:hypothetical protein
MDRPVLVEVVVIVVVTVGTNWLGLVVGPVALLISCGRLPGKLKNQTLILILSSVLRERDRSSRHCSSQCLGTNWLGLVVGPATLWEASWKVKKPNINPNSLYC